MPDMSEPILRFSIFFIVFVMMALLEFAVPRRKLAGARSPRWYDNLSLMVLGSFVVRLFLPLSIAAVGAYVESHNMGLFQLLDMPYWLKVILAVIILDLVIYTQHRLFHRVGFLWRMHQVHHTDRDVDVTTAVRFHPAEIFVSALIKVFAIIILGVPAVAVLLFEIILSSMALFNHSNIHLPKPLDRFLRLFIVTPDMHLLHHSIKPLELNSNYGFNLSLWDKIFKSYRLETVEENKTMALGLEQYQRVEFDIKVLLLLPLKSLKFKRK